MRRIPRLFVRKSCLVWPVGPREWDERMRGHAEITPAVQKLQKQHEDVYMVDVDGLEHTHANLEIYQRLERRGIHPWLEGGFRRLEDVMDAFFSGAEAVVIRLKDMHPDEFKELATMTDGPVHLSVDVGRQGLIGWTPHDIVDFVRRTEADGVVLQADHQVDAYRLGEVGSRFMMAGVHTTIAPWPGTRPDVTEGRADTMLVDMEVP